MDSEHPVSIAAAPWTLQADSWVFPFWNSSSTIKSGLPSGSYHPKENISEGGEDGKFKGGPGGWMLYRYSDSPVGPYDEIILVAGIFDTPGVAKGLRITNIYVSSDESIYNGRRNWNIPKHKARFEWSHAAHTNSTEVQTVSIYRADDPSSKNNTPFFTAQLRPSSYCPNIPLNTTYSFLPSLYLYQPPLLSSKYEKDSYQDKLAATTSDFLGTAPTFTGSFHLARIAPLSGHKSYGDGISFPQMPPGSLFVGFHFPSVQVGFPEPIQLQKKKQ